MPCRHPDVRKFDGVRCCLACGEAVFDAPKHAPDVATASVGAPPQHQYAHLNSSLGQEIRLIILLPGDQSDLIRCDIMHVNLEDHPSFEAVSYTWATEYGDDSKSGVVHLASGATLSVTANCEAALRQLRPRSHERPLWVDALCINQLNVEERNHQVGLMDRIYHGAQSVLISIPDVRGEWTDVALSDHNLRRLFVWLRSGGPDPGVSVTPYESHKEGFSYTGEPALATLKSLLQVRYFQRVWTVQEVALARNVVLHVNNEAVELSFPVLERIRLTKKVPAALRWNPGLARETDVLACLRAGIESHCSDARDKVYAVLSLMEPQARSFIPVDYSLDLDTIYTNALLAVIAAHGSLEVLSYALIENMLFVGGSQAMPVITLALFEMYISSPRPILHKGGPALSKQLECTVTSKWRPGITVKTTSILDAFVDECSDPDQSVIVFERRCTVTPGCLLPRFQTRARFIDTVNWHQQREGSMYRRLRSLDDMKFKNCSRFFPFFSRTPHPLSPFYEIRSGLHPDDRVTEQNSPGINVPDLLAFMKTLMHTEDDRKLFATHYSIGHARGDIRSGDGVYVLDGARSPLVLRNVGPHEYTIVTLCYLWAALELDYWNPGTQKGLWGSRHHDHACEQTQTIVIH